MSLPFLPYRDPSSPQSTRADSTWTTSVEQASQQRRVSSLLMKRKKSEESYFPFEARRDEKSKTSKTSKNNTENTNKNENNNENNENNENEDLQNGPDSVSAPRSDVKVTAQVNARRLRLKMELSDIAHSLLSGSGLDPDGPDGLGRVDRLCDDEDEIIQKWSLLTQVSIVCDLLPSFRIQIRPHREESFRVTSETRSLWKREASLLHAFECCSKNVLSRCRNEKKKPDLVVIRALSELVKRAFHFNLRNGLIRAAVHLANHNDVTTRQRCCEALQFVFQSDTIGDASLEIVTGINEIVKRRGVATQVELIETLCFIRFDDALLMNSNSNSQPEKKAFAKKSRRKSKESPIIDEAALKKDLSEGEIRPALKERKTNQTKILTNIFAIYLQLLQETQSSSQQVARLLPAVLKGLSAFSLLINIDILLDICDSLQSLIDPSRPRPLDPRSIFACVSALLKIMRSAHGSSLVIDDQRLYSHAYAALLSLDGVNPSDLVVEESLACVGLLFSTIKNTSSTRAAAFVHRLVMMSLHGSSKQSAAMLNCALDIQRKFNVCDSLFDSEYSGSGVFDITSLDVDASEILTTPCFTAALALWCTHPRISHAVAMLLTPRSSKPAQTKDLFSVSPNNDIFDLFSLQTPLRFSRQKNQTGKDVLHRQHLLRARNPSQPSPFLVTLGIKPQANITKKRS